MRENHDDEARKFLALKLSGPLYQGWGETEVLLDVWSFIATADRENVEFHLSLLCVLCEDLFQLLSLPVGHHAKQFWDLIFRKCLSCRGVTTFLVSLDRRVIQHRGDASTSRRSPSRTLAVAISSHSDLARRRGLKVLREMLVWMDRSSGMQNSANAECDNSTSAPLQGRGNSHGKAEDTALGSGSVSRSGILAHPCRGLGNTSPVTDGPVLDVVEQGSLPFNARSARPLRTSQGDIAALGSIRRSLGGIGSGDRDSSLRPGTRFHLGVL